MKCSLCGKNFDGNKRLERLKDRVNQESDFNFDRLCRECIFELKEEKG